MSQRHKRTRHVVHHVCGFARACPRAVASQLNVGFSGRVRACHTLLPLQLKVAGWVHEQARESPGQYQLHDASVRVKARTDSTCATCALTALIRSVVTRGQAQLSVRAQACSLRCSTPIPTKQVLEPARKRRHHRRWRRGTPGQAPRKRDSGSNRGRHQANSNHERDWRQQQE